MPQARFDLDCDALAATSTVAALISEPIEKQDPLANYSEQSPELPRLSYVEAMGGLVCDWSNGVSNFSSHNISGSSYAGVSIIILPEASDQYARFEGGYGPTGELSCTSPTSGCFFDKLDNGYWVSVELSGVILDDPTSDVPPDSVAEFVRSIEAITSALDAPDPRWVPPTGTIALAPDCQSILTASDVKSALALTDEPSVQRPHGGWSIWAGATVESGGGTCAWSTSDEGVFLSSVAWLPAGAWAAERLLPGTTSPSVVTPISIGSLKAGDKAFSRCAEDGSICLVDLIIGGNWVQTTAYRQLESGLGVQDGARALAEAIAARINS